MCVCVMCAVIVVRVVLRALVVCGVPLVCLVYGVPGRSNVYVACVVCVVRVV